MKFTQNRKYRCFVANERNARTDSTKFECVCMCQRIGMRPLMAASEYIRFERIEFISRGAVFHQIIYYCLCNEQNEPFTEKGKQK